jgi:hypothetical protein
LTGAQLFKTDAFLEAQPFGNVPAAFGPDEGLLPRKAVRSRDLMSTIRHQPFLRKRRHRSDRPQPVDGKIAI